MKCRYLDEITGGKGTIFATGTPLSNSMTELYTMQSYLQHDDLEERGLSHFDAWAANFGETQLSMELAPEGTGYQMKTRFSKFFNLPELMSMFKEIADIKTPDVLNLPVPKANFHTIVSEASCYQKEMVDALADRAKEIRDGRVDPKTDNMLRVTNDGRKLALDQRLANELLPDDENSKVNKCVRNVFDIWERTSKQRSAQMIFCDLSTPHYDGSFNVYDDIKEKLIQKGVPENEIAFIHDCKTDEDKQKMFMKVRSGEIRVLLGSTSKMGTGANAQKRLIALHHIDCPFRPSDLEQRNGRIIRQGNENPEVDIYNYVTKGTFDAFLYQLVESKQRFISQVMTSKSIARSAEDIDESVLSYAQIKAMASGNPKIKLKMDLDIEVSRLRTIFAAYQENKRNMQENISRTYPEEIQRYTQRISGLEKDIALAQSTKTTEFTEMTVDGKIYTNKKEAVNALLESCRTMRLDQKEKSVGSYRGFDMSVSFDSHKSVFEIHLKSALTHKVEIGKDAFGNLTRIENALDNLPRQLETAKTKLSETEHNLKTAKEEAVKPFPQLEELREKETKLEQLNKELSSYEKEPDDKETNSSNEEKTEKENKNITEDITV